MALSSAPCLLAGGISIVPQFPAGTRFTVPAAVSLKHECAKVLCLFPELPACLLVASASSPISLQAPAVPLLAISILTGSLSSAFVTTFSFVYPVSDVVFSLQAPVCLHAASLT